LNRKRFWGGQYDENKIAAYQTLCKCLITVAQLMAPIAPFYAERLFTDLNAATGKFKEESVHLTMFPVADQSVVDKNLEEKMFLAQKISSMALALRRTAKIKVRQPLQKLIIPVLDNQFEENIEHVRSIIMSEINVKEIELLKDTNGIVVKEIKPNFKALGKKLGKLMKGVSEKLAQFSQQDIEEIEIKGQKQIKIEGQSIILTLEEVEIVTKDMPGWHRWKIHNCT
jgi:isoleucyl-tRNA synthetase